MDEPLNPSDIVILSAPLVIRGHAAKSRPSHGVILSPCFLIPTCT